MTVSEKLQAGVCEKCDEPAGEFRRCAECRRKDVERHQRRHAQNAAAGICRMCGQSPRLEGNQYCVGCRPKSLTTSAWCRKRKIESGECITCSNQATRGTRCQSCSEKNMVVVYRRRAKAIAEGLCRHCGQDAILTNRSLRGRDRSGYCAICYLKRMARGLLGDSKQWPVLLDKLWRCDWKCHYTGEKLVLGDNLSFDHMNPVSRFPEQACDPRNLFPVTWQVNLMKRDLTQDEFFALVDKISSVRRDKEEARVRDTERL